MEREAAGVASTYNRPERGDRQMPRHTLPAPHVYHEAVPAVSTTTTRNATVSGESVHATKPHRLCPMLWQSGKGL